MSDPDLAQQLHCPTYVVKFKRCSLNIPAFADERLRPWTPEETQLLGILSDGEVARRTGRSLSAIITRRARLQIPMKNP